MLVTCGDACAGTHIHQPVPGPELEAGPQYPSPLLPHHRVAAPPVPVGLTGGVHLTILSVCDIPYDHNVFSVMILMTCHVS